MGMTIEQFKKQNAFWQDKYYTYAIHKTDGGAMYLFQVDGLRLTQEKINSANIIRIDGLDFNKLIENIKGV